MDETHVLPELKEIVGAMLFAAKEPISAGQIKRVLGQVGEQKGGAEADFAKATEGQIKAVLEELDAELRQRHIGMEVVQVAKGYRLQNRLACGPWVRQLLQKGRGNRLSRPALETLAIIAYRQPCVRSEIEAVRGVAVDQILRNLLELQLVRIVGRSELPGRPMLYGTTQKFLEYFGINDLNDLPGVEELKGLEGSKAEKGTQAAAEEDVEDDDEVRDSEDEGEPDEDESAEDADGEDAS